MAQRNDRVCRPGGSEMLATRLERLRSRYRKTVPDLLALVRGRYPKFVTAARGAEIVDEIVIFAFHDVEAPTLEAQLAHLARNGYRTLSAEELRQGLAGESEIQPRSVVLTFDDGLASVRSVAHPLLARYGLRGIAFVVSGHVPERTDSGGPFCSWEEIREMSAAGTFEFHSHSHHHDRVPASPEVVDFLHPGFDASFANSKVPATHVAGTPGFGRELEWGTPIFRSEPRMAGTAPYLDDEGARAACRRHVAEQGGEAFFQRSDWRGELSRRHQQAAADSGAPRYAGHAQVEALIEEDLRRSRETIRTRVPSASADHLCFPWYAGSDLATTVAARVGFRAIHWGILHDRRANRSGGDPLRIARVDERYLLRLPGEGRVPLRAILSDQLRASLRRG